MGARGLVRVDEWGDECRIGGNTGAAGNAGWMRFATRGMRRALVHVPMMVPAMTVPFLSSMVTDSWLSFWRNLTSFIFAAPVPTPVRYFLAAVTDYPFGSTRAAVCVRSRWRASSRRTIRACPRGVSRVRSRSRRGAGVRLTRVLRLAFEAFRRVFTVSVPRLTGWLAPTTHRHSQVTCVSPRLFPPRSHNEEHEGTRGGSVRAFGASRVER